MATSPVFRIYSNPTHFSVWFYQITEKIIIEDNNTFILHRLNMMIVSCDNDIICCKDVIKINMSTCNDGSCGSNKCGPGCGCPKCNKSEWMVNTGYAMVDNMAILADKAWEAVLIDKMKVLWQDQMGEKMDKIAEATVGVSIAFHMGKMKSEMDLGEAAGKLKASFAN